MSYLLWEEFRTTFPRDEPKWPTVRHFAFCINNVIIWNDCFVEPYNDFVGNGKITFEPTLVDVEGVETEAVLMKNGDQEYTVVCPPMLTAMFLSDPVIIERWIEKDGQFPAPGWTFDDTKEGFPRFYIEEDDAEGKTYRIWGTGEKEYI